MSEAPVSEASRKALYEALLVLILKTDTPQLIKLRGMPDRTIRKILKDHPIYSSTEFLVDKVTATAEGFQTEVLADEVVAAVASIIKKPPTRKDHGSYEVLHMGNTGHLNCSASPPLRRELRAYFEKVHHREMLIEKRGADAVYWAEVAQGKVWINDTYFPVTELVKHKFPWPHHQFERVDDQNAIVKAVVKELQSMGIRRLGVLWRGSFSTVFETAPDKEGRMQLVTLLSCKDSVIDHPCFVPSKDVRTVEAGKNKVTVIVSPELLRDEVTEEHVKELIGRFEKSGLEQKDLYSCGMHQVHWRYRTENVALYREHPNDNPIAFCVDRGAVKWPDNMDADAQARAMRRWDADGTLDSHRAVHRKYRHKGLENIRLIQMPSAGRRALLMAEADLPSHALIDAADHKGIMPNELQSMSLDAVRNSSNGEEWAKRFRVEVVDFDPTSHPDSRPTRRR